jgi:Cadherin domain.
VISIADVLDFEKAREYLLTIQATDLGTPPLYSQASVNISVTDVNDNAPEFTQMSFSAVVSEDLAPGELVTQVRVLGSIPASAFFSDYLEREKRYKQVSKQEGLGAFRCFQKPP